MKANRRSVLLSTLFGAGCVGLRALATGLPVSLLLNPRRALANGCPTGVTPQYVILNTSGQGDPLNANAPGTYDDPRIYHCPVAGMEETSVTLGTQSVKAATPWSLLPGDRTSVWHIMTDTPVHPKEPDVLGLNNALLPVDMFPSFLARNLAPCLGTLQTQPISLGATSPSEGLTYAGAALPIIPPLALQATLTAPQTPLGKLAALRAQTLDQLNDVYLKGASPAQKSFVDSLVTSQTQVQNISQSLLGNLASIKDNTADSQIIGAVTLIQMKVAPVIAIHIPFGGDNHHDTGLATEGAQTIAGMTTLSTLIANLTSAGLADAVSIISLNVFGRTLGASSTNGRQHNPNHQVSFAIGKPFKGGVVGGLTEMDDSTGVDFGALGLVAKTGAGVATGADVSALDTLPSYAMTVATGVGIDPTVIAAQVTRGAVITGALAS
jgi:hypothetical protein